LNSFLFLLYLNSFVNTIDELKYKIEKKIFSNKSIFFYEKERDYEIDYGDDDKKQKKYSFLQKRIIIIIR
jgi:hypothetical protein